MKKNPSSLDNFARFLTENHEETHEVQEIINAIHRIPDPVLRERIYYRINVELGVILLRKTEIQQTLRQIFHAELREEGHENIEELLRSK